VSNQNCENIVGPYVQKLRVERGWSLDQLADRFSSEGISVSRQTLERIEFQQEAVTEIDVMAFAHVLKTDVDKLYPPNVTEALEELRLNHQTPRPSDDHLGFVLESLSASG
jgi:transcriptional regulator with XRE-family HTH domain